ASPPAPALRRYPSLPANCTFPEADTARTWQSQRRVTQNYSKIYEMGDTARSTKLFDVASTQHGYFSTAQAIAVGFSRLLLSHHARTGRVERARRGLYRLHDPRCSRGRYGAGADRAGDRRGDIAWPAGP